MTIKLYLDNCVFNRPFDDQANIKVLLDTILTTDKGILKKSAIIQDIHITDPIDFIREVFP